MNPKNATTDSESGLRFYRWQDRDLPSVTSLRRMLGMPFTLHQWVLSRVVSRAVTEYDTLGQMLTRERRPRERVLETNRIKEAKAWLRSAATEERDAAGDVGTAVHEAIDAGVSPSDPSLDPVVASYLVHYYDFLTLTGAKVIWQERQVFNLTLGYAGTADLLLQMPNRDIILVDLKTTSGVYVDHALQVLGYSLGEFVGADDVVDEVATAWLQAATKMAVLHLKPNGWELVTFKPLPLLREAFVASLRLGLFFHTNETVADLVESITTK